MNVQSQFEDVNVQKKIEPTVSLRGWIDRLEPPKLLGWGYDVEDPGRTLEVIVVIDEQALGRCIAVDYRDDLREAGIGTGMHAFSFNVPWPFFDGDKHRIDLVDARSMTSILGETVEVHFPVHHPVTPEPSSLHQLKKEYWDLPRPEQAAPIRPWQKTGERVLIVGSAPTTRQFADRIRAFNGEVWALNDALFWLNETNISVDRLFVTDTRFLRKNVKQMPKANFGALVTIDTVDIVADLPDGTEIFTLKCVGRDGFVTEFGKVFHGCSVLFTALQCAAALRYPNINTCGVLLSCPSLYARIDGTRSLPEYVHDVQIRNARLAMTRLREQGIRFEAFENHSNLNFL